MLSHTDQYALFVECQQEAQERKEGKKAKRMETLGRMLYGD